MKLKFYILFLFILLSVKLSGQENNPELNVSVSKNKLGVNQRLRVQYEINVQGADNFKQPNFKNFIIIGGPSQSVSQSWINGKSSFSQSYTYIIKPKAKGEYSLPPASIEINGKKLFSKSIKIIVLDAVKIPKDSNDPYYIADQNIHLVAEVSKTKPYVGEGVYVEYRLYFSNNIAIYDNAITKSPQYNGFWNQEIKRKGMPIKMAIYNGEKYRYAVLHKALLIPTKSGKLTIDPMKMDIVVSVPTGEVDFFGNPITREVRKEFSSIKKIVNSKELPIKNKPDDFNGAVGDFRYNVTLNKNSLKSNESSQVKIAVIGNGNLKLFELPKIIVPKELEVYEPERNENISITSSGIRGTVSNLYTIVPQYKGKYKIPKTSFSYFNPKDKKYYTIKSTDLYVDVKEGKEISSKTDINVSKQNIKLTGKDFRFINTKTKFESIKGNQFFNSSFFYFLLIFPLIMIPVIMFLCREKIKDSIYFENKKYRKADKLAKKYLFEAKKNITNKELFYESLERALNNFLKAKLGIQTFDISKDKIKEMLINRKVDSISISNFMEVFEHCDFARYTPATDLQIKEEYEKAKQIITQLDKQL